MPNRWVELPARGWPLVALLALAHGLAPVGSNGRYGMFRDEYYYLACARRLAWGYVDHPPLSIGKLTWWTSWFRDSAASVRILPALCGGALVLLAGAIARELGGQSLARFLAALSIAIAPSYLLMTSFCSMNAFDMVIWAGLFVCMLQLFRTGNETWWLATAFLAGIGLLNKHTLGFEAVDLRRFFRHVEQQGGNP